MQYAVCTVLLCTLQKGSKCSCLKSGCQRTCFIQEEHRPSAQYMPAAKKVSMILPVHRRLPQRPPSKGCMLPDTSRQCSTPLCSTEGQHVQLLKNRMPANLLHSRGTDSGSSAKYMPAASKKGLCSYTAHDRHQRFICPLLYHSTCFIPEEHKILTTCMPVVLIRFTDRKSCPYNYAHTRLFLFHRRTMLEFNHLPQTRSIWLSTRALS
jgi:hypothetical protein